MTRPAGTRSATVESGGQAADSRLRRTQFIRRIQAALILADQSQPNPDGLLAARTGATS